MNIDAITAFATSIPIDWMMIGGFAILAAADVSRNGAGRASAIALSLPAALLLTSTFPQTVFLGDLIDETSTPLLSGIIFLLFATALYFLMRRMDVSYGGEYSGPFQALLAGVAVTAVIVVVWLEVPSLATLWLFGDNVQSIFSEGYRFWWLIGSFASLAFARS